MASEACPRLRGPGSFGALRRAGAGSAQHKPGSALLLAGGEAGEAKLQGDSALFPLALA